MLELPKTIGFLPKLKVLRCSKNVFRHPKGSASRSTSPSSPVTIAYVLGADDESALLYIREQASNAETTLDELKCAASSLLLRCVSS